MVAAAKPVSGQPIATDWGSQVHDTAVLARGVIVTGATSGTAAASMPLDVIVAGDPTMVNMAANDLVCPVDGVYKLQATIQGIGQAVGGSYYAHVYERGGTGAYQNLSGCAPSGGGSGRRFTIAGLIVATAGQRFWINNVAPGSGGTQQADRVEWSLIAQTLGSA